MSKILAFICLLLIGQYAVAQELDLKNPLFETDSSLLAVESPNWSPDGNSLVFSAFTDGKWSLFIYKIDKDTLIELRQTDYNMRKPVWHSNGNAIVCDKIGVGYHKLVLFDLRTTETSELLNREIKSSSASFSENPNLICFLGFDEVRETWQVYTYDFVYDNLNQLTNHKTSCLQPCFSPDGKHILYQQVSEIRDTSLIMLNWYGNVELKFDSIDSFSPSWHKNSWRFYFIGKDRLGEREVFSLRKDGKSLMQITDNYIQEKDFVLSPNGKNAALIVDEKNTKRLLIIEISE